MAVARLAVLLAGVLALGACAADSKDGNTIDGGVVDSKGVDTLYYNGKPLYCVTYDRGISCDWVRYHNENPQ